ncbi:MAG: hypothetical protein AAGF66_17790 [Cyanobacteria bacterium P01_H01_bin.119]
MRYLARVLKKAFLHGAELELLAYRVTQFNWELLPRPQHLKTSKIVGFNEGSLVLVDVLQQPTPTSETPENGNDNGEADLIDGIEDATDWVLELISAYLTRNMTPEMLVQEVERAEQWRQSLTLQSQEVGRRALETAARRDEIQELEKNLKLEQEAIARREAQLNAKAGELSTLAESLAKRSQDLNRREAQLDAKAAELEALSESLAKQNENPK